MIIKKNRPLANVHQERPASCNWSSRGSGLLQMIIWRDQPFANDLPDDLASCKWSFGGSGILQAPCKWSSVTLVTLVTFARILRAHELKEGLVGFLTALKTEFWCDDQVINQVILQTNIISIHLTSCFSNYTENESWEISWIGKLWLD